MVLVCAKRVRLPAGAKEREHQPFTESVAKRMVGDQLLELRHDLGRAPARELGIDESLVRDETELVETSASSGPILVRELGVGLAVPHRECGAQCRGRRHSVVALHCGPTGRQQWIEPAHVEGLVGDLQRVSR